MDAGKEQGIWARNGLDPEWVTISGRPIIPSDYKGLIENGVKMGITAGADPLITRASGVSVKIVAGYVGLNIVTKVFVRSDSQIKTLEDLDGKKIGVVASNDPFHRNLLYLSNRFGIKVEPVPLGNLTNQVVALKLGKVDGFMSGQGAALRLVDSGELRVAVQMSDVFPKPWALFVVFATDDLIENNPDVVRRFVKATLETVRYLKEYPGYAADLYIKKTNAPRDLAAKAVSQIDWQAGGRGSGQDLILAASNGWQYAKDSGVIPAEVNMKIEDAVDMKFLP